MKIILKNGRTVKADTIYVAHGMGGNTPVGMISDARDGIIFMIEGLGEQFVPHKILDRVLARLEGRLITQSQLLHECWTEMQCVEFEEVKYGVQRTSSDEVILPNIRSGGYAPRIGIENSLLVQFLPYSS